MSAGVCVLVMGELARSPRMCYHAQSLARSGHPVLLMGYVEGGRRVSLPPSVRVRPLLAPPECVRRLPAPLCLAVRLLWQTLTLLWALATAPHFRALLVQTPPGVPALPVGWLVCRARGARLLVDWHNYSGAVLALALRAGSRLPRLVARVEFLVGSRADACLCVTEAMRDDLTGRLGGSSAPAIVTLHDRPAARFRPVSLEESHALFFDLSAPGGLLEPVLAWLSTLLKQQQPLAADRQQTAFTERTDGAVRQRQDRPALLVSSTSWTDDEDFGVLLLALAEYESARHSQRSVWPPLVCVITGRGPRRDFYLQQLRQRQWSHVLVLSGWLSELQYPLLLASADLGVSLHVSASGLDLPMKVVDMFGAGLPVCAHQFACLAELVQHGENGLVFGSHQQLAEQLLAWFRGFPSDDQLQARQRRFRANIDTFRRRGWHENWLELAAPLF